MTSLRKLFYLLMFLSFSLSLSAQKKEIEQARQFVKKGTNLDKAESSMRTLLNDSSNKRNEKIWHTLFSAIKKQYDQGNEKLYLKQKYDTTTLFVVCKKMFDVLEEYDSIDVLPDKKGIVNPRYRSKHAELLSKYRQNLYNGGNFFIKKQDYKQALSMYETYIGCAYHPMFKTFNYLEKDNQLHEAAYWALYSAYKQKDLNSMLKYKSLAQEDRAHYPYMLQYLAEQYIAAGDTTQYLSVLTEGFELYPDFIYFFPRLTEYYLEQDDLDKADEIVTMAINTDGNNLIYRYAKSSVLLKKEQYTDAIKICDDIIQQDSTFVDAYLNAGLSYFNQAIKLEKDLREAKKNQKKILSLYRSSLPYFERYRQLAPKQKTRWSLPLYTIYLNLNMGKEFDEMNKIINEK